MSDPAEKSLVAQAASLTLISCVAVTALSGTAAVAATRSFLNVPGIPGESLTKAHPDWIEVSAFALKFTRNRCSGLTIQKTLDLASPALSAAAVSAQGFPTMTLETETNAQEPVVYLRLALSNARVVSVDASVPTGGTGVSETIVLRAAEVKMTYVPQNGDGSPGKPVESVLDCVPGR